MKFQTASNETIFISEIDPEHRYMFNQDLRTGLTIVWNTGKEAMFKIDNQDFAIARNCIAFFTEYHIIEDFQFERMNVIQFNRPFYCVEDSDSEVGCRGVLFFGASDIPKVEISKDQEESFKLLWKVLRMELDESDDLKLEMLRALLKRFLLLSLRVYRMQRKNLPFDNVSIGLIREYNYLVEKHFKEFTKVADYADLLHRSPKTIANAFGKHIDKTPLQIINERRMLEAKRMLRYTDKTIQEIGEEINFKDVQSFSHFFKSNEGVAPGQFRSKRN